MERFSYGNFGGRWGAGLKFAGYDAIVVRGKSEKPVYLFIHDGTAELKDASALWGKGAIETREILKGEFGSSLRVVAIGQAGENMAVMANLIADNDAAGSKGLGAVLGSKKLKAIAVKWEGKAVKVAQPEKLKELSEYYRRLKIGFPYYDEAFHNVLSRWSHDPRLEFRTVPGEGVLKKEPCYGCLGRCPRSVYRVEGWPVGEVHLPFRLGLPALGGAVLQRLERCPLPRHQALRQLRAGYHCRRLHHQLAECMLQGRHPHG